METHIYGLISIENTNEIRYVGKSNDIYCRLKRHIRNTKLSIKNNKKLTHKDYWIIKNNFKIDVVLLETCDESIWGEREKYWMSKYSNLTNTSSGGLGGSGLKYLLSYEEVKSWVKENMNVKSKNDWYKQIKNINSDNIPKEPREVYLNRGWISWGDFLGTNNKYTNDVNYISYDDAKPIIKNLNINSIEEYKKLVKYKLIPDNIPNRPERYYKNRGWVSWGDFLGTNKIANQNKIFMSYDEFKIFIKDNNIKTYTEFKNKRKDLKKLNEKIPTNPNIIYNNVGWVSWASLYI